MYVYFFVTGYVARVSSGSALLVVIILGYESDVYVRMLSWNGDVSIVDMGHFVAYR